MSDPTPLWQPSPERIRQSQMYDFMNRVARQQGIAAEWEALRQWSLDHPEQFWPAMLEYAKVQPSAPARAVVTGRGMLGTKWFDGLTLNYARHLLRFDDDGDAIIHENEPGVRGRISQRQLRAEVARCAAALRRVGVERGNRVAGFMPNVP